ncbi:DUF563 domain-containing protein [Roseomonas sp. CECT 9278]|uniref:glycosyltransferase family 61 protein n=1 Tax=Roseomonas sp. CECT 9278 TaxID=2845823 RepID=UPI001E4EAE40|nr:glycosyltransferase family 61 protein [Roseomonas sp. CECT 9278]CAH0189126.1 hypothetical protein ROS9278_01638 [Roseomonas sp. CECT 9278]
MTASRLLRLPALSWPTCPARLHRARVIGGDWTVFNTAGALWCPTQRPRACTRRDGASIEIDASLPVQHLREPVALLGGSWNYYHALADFALNLGALEQVPGGAARTLLVDDFAEQYAARIATALGVAPGRFQRVPKDRMVRCDDLLVLPHALGGAGQLRDMAAIDWLRAAAARAALADRDAPALPRRILVSRSGAARRRVRNAQAIARLCALRGFTEVQIETLPLVQAWRLFAQAEAVVAPHGAGLANILFMQRGALLLELVPGRGYCPPMFTNIAAVLGLRHVVLPQDAGQNAPDFRVDPVALRTTLDTMLGRG